MAHDWSCCFCQGSYSSVHWDNMYILYILYIYIHNVIIIMGLIIIDDEQTKLKWQYWSYHDREHNYEHYRTWCIWIDYHWHSNAINPMPQTANITIHEWESNGLDHYNTSSVQLFLMMSAVVEDIVDDTFKRMVWHHLHDWTRTAIMGHMVLLCFR